MQKQEAHPVWRQPLKASEDAGAWDLVIEPPARWAPLDFGELWAYRELLAFLVWRNIKIRYKQTVLGAAWARGLVEAYW